MKSIYKIATILVLLLAAMTQLNGAVSVPAPLVDTNWLEKNKNSVVILDVQEKVKKDMETIAGATIVNWKDVRAKKNEDGMTLEKMLPTKEQFSSLMQNHGVNNGSAVIITNDGKDAKTIFLATRLYWQLKYFGHDNVALLDGGNAKWIEENRTVAISTIPLKGNFIAKVERKELLATTSDVENALKSKDTVLVDGRGEDQYLGLSYKKEYVYEAGHIPGAKLASGNLFLTNDKGKTFQNTALLKEIFKAKGITIESKGISYCNSGHMASGTWFVQHELLGNKNFKMYDGSMHAWTKGNIRETRKLIYE